MARYHEVGRLSEDKEPNLKLSLYHLQKAACCGVKDALYVLAHIHLQAPHDEFKLLTVEVRRKTEDSLSNSVVVMFGSHIFC